MLVVFYIVMAFFSICISLLMYKTVLLAVVVLAFAPRIKSYITSIIIERRRAEYMQEFKDFLFLAGTSIGAGRSMPDAIDEAIPGLEEIYTSNSILAKELRIVSRRIKSKSEDDVDVLMELAMYSGIDDVVDFVTVYQVCKQTGANLISSMNKASSMIIDKMTIEKEIKEIVKRKEYEGLFIFCMPVLVIVALNLTSPDYIAPLYETYIGRLVMTLVIVADLGIYGWIKRITNVKL